MTKARYNAEHADGTKWQLVAKPLMAANFVRNYCRKHRIPGDVMLTDVATGEIVNVTVNSDYTI